MARGDHPAVQFVTSDLLLSSLLFSPWVLLLSAQDTMPVAGDGIPQQMQETKFLSQEVLAVWEDEKETDV